jgi:hypothetical protein
VIERGMYRHYRSGLYEVLGVAVDATASSGDDRVIYRNEAGEIYHRTVKDFEATKLDRDGNVVQRFTRVPQMERFSRQVESRDERIAEARRNRSIIKGVATSLDEAVASFKRIAVPGGRTNPKTATGNLKRPQGCVSQAVVAELGVAMMEGDRKHGRHNYRAAPVLASIMFDATRRHLDDWWEGEDDDSDSGLSHVTKAIASLTVLRDAMIFGTFEDDRPPKVPEWHKKFLDEKVKEILARYPLREKPFTEKDRSQDG